MKKILLKIVFLGMGVFPCSYAMEGTQDINDVFSEEVLAELFIRGAKDMPLKEALKEIAGMCLVCKRWYKILKDEIVLRKVLLAASYDITRRTAMVYNYFELLPGLYRLQVGMRDVITPVCLYTYSMGPAIDVPQDFYDHMEQNYSKDECHFLAEYIAHACCTALDDDERRYVQNIVSLAHNRRLLIEFLRQELVDFYHLEVVWTEFPIISAVPATKMIQADEKLIDKRFRRFCLCMPFYLTMKRLGYVPVLVEVGMMRQLDEFATICDDRRKRRILADFCEALIGLLTDREKEVLAGYIELLEQGPLKRIKVEPKY